MSMMIEITAMAAATVGGRAYLNAASETPLAPYITLFRVIAIEQVDLDLNGGAGNLVNTRVQVDVWAKTYSQSQLIAAEMKASLKVWATQNIIQSEQDLYEPDTKLHRVSMDVSIWHL